METMEFCGKAILMGVGIATGAYDLLIINFTMLVLAHLYGLSSWESSLIASASLIGTFSGQLIFGISGDKIGRKTTSLITCFILLFGAIGSGALSYSFGGPTLVLYCTLAAWRFILGFGIGGEYPVTAIFTGENASGNPKSRGSLIAGMFSSQGVGNLIAAIVFFLLLISLPSYLNYVWRLALIIGSIPPLFVLLPRMRMKESPAFDNSPKNAISYLKVIKIYWKKLLGTAGCWFLFDIVFYGNSLFSGPILQAVGITEDDTWEGITANVLFNIVIALIALPGYWCGTFLIDKIGRKPLQLIGFVMMAIIFICIGVFYTRVSENVFLFIFLYGLSYFFSNAGPNTTTFVIPTETYPSKIRSTCHGFSAASGKVGAMIGAVFISPLLAATNPQTIFIICGSISILGAILTIICIQETKGICLESLDTNVNFYVEPVGSPDSINNNL